MTRPYAETKEINEVLLLDEIKSKKTVLMGLPPRITFEISRACNYVCKKCCYSANSNPPGTNFVNAPEWSKEDIERVADELFPSLQYTESTLLGEPFLNKNFKWLMDLYRKYGVWYRPTTNGSLITEEKLEQANGVIDWLKCSFDAANKELYHKLYLKDNFDNVSKNLKMFSEKRWHMRPMPWFRIGLVLMKSNLNHLIEYADYCNEVLGVDDIEIMSLNYANHELRDEVYFNIPSVVNKKIDELIDHCIEKKYRLRLPFIKMGTPDFLPFSRNLRANNKEILSRPHSDEVKRGDIFGNKEQIEDNYIWSNQDRISSIKAYNGSEISGICDFWVRNFLKPPSIDGDPALWVEACGSCSTFRFGDLKKNTFKEIYNNELNQKIRQFMYEKNNLPRDKWPQVCQKCLCVDSIYSEKSNGLGNQGRHYGIEDDLYKEK